MGVQILVSQILFLSVVVLAGFLIQRLVRLELTLSCLLAGVISGFFVTWSGFDTGIRASNISDLIFFVVLPVLIFDAAWHLKPGVLKRWLPPIFLLTTLGLVAGWLVIAVIIYYLMGSPQWFPWQAALIVGAILSATDPVSVVSTLKRQKASEDLEVLVEGESLFNDAGSLILFSVALGFAMTSGEPSEQNYLQLFLMTFFGGLLVGSMMGLLGSILVLLLNSSAVSNVVLLMLAFSSFFVAEHFFHVSGIMSLVSAALVSRMLLREHEVEFLQGVTVTWEWLGLFFNGLIFVLMGLVITFDMFAQQWLAMGFAILAALLGRFVTVFLCGQLTRPMVNSIPLGWQSIMVWGGLRGAISIALVLSLPVSLPYWWTIQSMVFGVVMFTLVVQGPTTGMLIKRVG